MYIFSFFAILTKNGLPPQRNLDFDREPAAKPRFWPKTAVAGGEIANLVEKRRRAAAKTRIFKKTAAKMPGENVSASTVHLAVPVWSLVWGLENKIRRRDFAGAGANPVLFFCRPFLRY